MSDQILLGPLILFASVMSLTPGPNVVLVTASAANFGFRRTIPMMFGITLGFGLLVVAAGLGLAGLIQAEPRAQIVMRYAGSIYLLYLAWCIARAEASNGTSPRAKPIGFLGAMLLQGVNPKGWVFAFGALAAYTTVGGNVLRETAIIAAINATTCFISVVVWSGFGTLIGRFLHNPRARMIFNWTMAGLLILSLIPIFW